ncbi:MAG: class I SAM-dependent methyltransferase [Candidatus Aminicenantes bacterium]|nr:class I SAM-dependent methyltransferase [Candidatus Aminicenantes bacterium]
MVTKVECPVCHSHMKYLFKKFDHDFFQCNDCKFGKFNPVPDEKDILKRYSDDYFINEYLQSYGASDHSVDMKVIYSRFDFIEQLVSKYHPENLRKKKILDIGCGGGFLLKTFQERGWEVFGIDIIDRSIEFGRRVLGIPMEKLNFESTSPGKLIEKYGKFNLISITDVLEHFFDPISVLKKIADILKNDGVLFLSVPNIESISFKYIGKEWAIISPLEHISYFSPRSLKIILEKNGFENINIQILQYVNLANVHKKSVRYHMARIAIYLITRVYHIGFEGKEFYPEILHEKYFKENENGGFMGDVIIATGQKKNER